MPDFPRILEIPVLWHASSPNSSRYITLIHYKLTSPDTEVSALESAVLAVLDKETSLQSPRSGSKSVTIWQVFDPPVPSKQSLSAYKETYQQMNEAYLKAHAYPCHDLVPNVPDGHLVAVLVINLQLPVIWLDSPTPPRYITSVLYEMTSPDTEISALKSAVLAVLDKELQLPQSGSKRVAIWRLINPLVPSGPSLGAYKETYQQVNEAYLEAHAFPCHYLVPNVPHGHLVAVLVNLRLPVIWLDSPKPPRYITSVFYELLSPDTEISALKSAVLAVLDKEATSLQLPQSGSKSVAIWQLIDPLVPSRQSLGAYQETYHQVNEAYLKAHAYPCHYLVPNVPHGHLVAVLVPCNTLLH